ncbi:hypothetical protein DTO195F2_5187 [Paecilomyces variotii]|nr:hypothetical protein DTO195F2_5187 [Paecilomyces variotii]KAJ9369263.1 hypothetical protein DTO282E5_6060 [Paecilomyces variotii]
MNQRSASLIDKDRPGRSWLRLRTRPATRQTFSPVYARSNYTFSSLYIRVIRAGFGDNWLLHTSFIVYQNLISFCSHTEAFWTDGGPRGPNKVKPHLHGRTPAPEKKLPSMGRHRAPPTAHSHLRRANPHLTAVSSAAAPKPSGTSMSPKAMTVFGVGILAISSYCGYLYTSYRQDVARSRSLSVPDDVTDRYDQTAPSYDAEVEMGEKVMRLGKRRKELVQMARGDVLEVSCGTGRNMDYYDLGERRGVDANGKAELKGCRSVTFVDLSPVMIEIARKKFEKLYPGFQKVAFQVGDASQIAPSPPAGKTPPTVTRKPYFDTVLETMGLCSTPDPVALLRHLGDLTEPAQGRILLLEHGRSYYGWLNNILDNLAPAHANRHGCWWNRDIGDIVEKSGLEVVEIKRYHLGTTWRVILRPRKETRIEEVK